LSKGVLGRFDFARLIGKIAHGYAVAFLGVDGFVPSVVPAIIGASDDIGVWVGTAGATLFEEICARRVADRTCNSAAA